MPDQDTLERLQQRLSAELERIAEMMLAAHRREIPDLPDDPDIQGALREAVRADLTEAFTAFRVEQRLPRTLTFETSHWARLAARARIPLPTLLRLFRVGQHVVWRELCSLLDELEPDAARREAMVRLITDVMFEAGDRMSTLQAEEYLAERDVIMRSREQTKLALVQLILSDASADTGALEYDLRGDHVAVVASGADAARVMRAVVQPRRLVVQAAPDTVWGWFGSAPRELAAGAAGITLGVSRTSSGRDGFVLGHEQARAAHALGGILGRPLTHFDAISLQWLATRDRAGAIRFVADELGPLLGDADRAEKLLDTLEAYLEAGHNASSMAAQLGISVRTASYRIRSIEQLLGRTVASRNAELHAALRLRHLTERW